MDKKVKAGFMACMLAFAVMLAAGCEKAPVDEDIEGFWRLERFRTNADGKTHECDRLYYSITRYVVEVSEKQGSGGYGTFIGRFEYVDGSRRVAMRDFRRRAATSDSGVRATAEELRPFGLGDSDTVFDVVSAGGGRLVLKSDYAILELTEF